MGGIRVRRRGKAAAREGAREDEKLGELVGYNLRRAWSYALSDFVVEFADNGLRPVPYGMLATIAERPGITATELCRLLGMKRANTAPLINEMEEQGLVERVAYKEDRRIQHLFLSASAKAAMPRIQARIRQHEDRFLHRLTEAERVTLLDLLQRIWKDEEG
ncbi:Transcriptional regulator, MarR family (plasmid) [Roseomonas mucosa]|uniref:MarR family transcriptional regulator n=1 Tax=Roseomonas mucosa TaxID=207340 RepID=A0A1S8DAP9_9PROT|nr:MULTISPECIES: MarR family transcriptional regulator [Roseomonas]MBS5903882.1 MarR family transcriptional regulator [Acetobacteraceae bacterium]ATR18832.1 MarR family transcriptional regulator [Roseomonas sp. FDAARGOS_362]AWV20742.1 Transcriptional regulator, MarR family [Roseomonas mucosa]MCG7350518.1 MarR family transcriptional regulator [Roseomonas mucosa]MCG7355798.1 MarR family transcriptional regulator [Roseomonas mucosa]